MRPLLLLTLPILSLCHAFDKQGNDARISPLSAGKNEEFNQAKVKNSEIPSEFHNFTPNELIQEAEKNAQNDQLLAAARKLRLALGGASDSSTIDRSSLKLSHRKLLDVADRLEATILDLSSPPDPNIWTKQGEVHDGKHDMLVYYKLDQQRRLTSRIEFLIDKELLVPILAVLVETELYNTWVPSWRFPPVGVRHVRKIAQTGRTNQVIHADVDIPWKRDVIISSIGVEDVEEHGLLGIHLGPKPEGEELGESGQRVPYPEKGVVRVDFEACFVFQKCPANHPCLIHNAQLQDSASNDVILVGFSMFADAKISSLFPQWIVNFIVRVAMVRLFRIFIGVAEEIHAGRRPDHTAAIHKRSGEIYDWIEERVNTMLKAKDA
ncbi:expressed unknown protein [Seminavis robusta]|uniref:START domain-containing protein n=1 Tax=Seminavis robusta TaxID=568900 RepID=A0A9N8DUG9_9STRA|nr:expressed unknown protein [Seminavis robusta]|eukprot:Sro289_g109120.1 n/a (380) ;mRNA; f:48049-49188